MNKRVPFTEQDEDNVDSVFYWRRRYNEAVDKWVKLDSQMLKLLRENDAMKTKLNQLKGEA